MQRVEFLEASHVSQLVPNSLLLCWYSAIFLRTSGGRKYFLVDVNLIKAFSIALG